MLIDVKGVSKQRLYSLSLTQGQIYIKCRQKNFVRWNLERDKVCETDDVTGRWLSKLQDADLLILPLSASPYPETVLTWPANELGTEQAARLADTPDPRACYSKEHDACAVQDSTSTYKKIQRWRGDSCHGNHLPPTGLDHHSKINKKTEKGYLPARFIDEREHATASVLKGRQSLLQASVNTIKLQEVWTGRYIIVLQNL